MESSEVKVTIRPIKVTALVNVLLAAVLLIISLTTPYWLEATDFNEGICDCRKGSCYLPARIICLAASIIALAVTVVAFVLLLFHLPNKKMEQPKFKLYVASVVAVFIAMICLLVTLIVFPVIFINVERQKYTKNYGDNGWHLSWSYGGCWGAWLFLLGAAVLLLIDRNRNVSVWNCSTVYDTPL